MRGDGGGEWVMGSGDLGRGRVLDYRSVRLLYVSKSRLAFKGLRGNRAGDGQANAGRIGGMEREGGLP